MLKTIVTIILITVAVLLIILVMMQDDQNRGLGAIGGMSSGDTYWNQNKGRSKEGRIRKGTAICTAVLIGLTLLLSTGILSKPASNQATNTNSVTTTSSSSVITDS